MKVNSMFRDGFMKVNMALPLSMFNCQKQLPKL